MNKWTTGSRWLLLVALCALPRSAQAATRIAELCDVRGVRPNQLIGYGLVVGLANTGDTDLSRFTVQSTAAMLRRLGATIDPTQIQTRNAAAVMVIATLPANANPGMRIDVVVSSIGNARNIDGGTLLQTPLFGADRTVYAVAQGPLLVGGFVAESAGSYVRYNAITVGRVPGGAIVERPAPSASVKQDMLVLQLRVPSYVTASRIVAAINKELGADVAHAIDAGSIQLKVADDQKADPVGLLARVQLLQVEADSAVRVVIDERTGTVVLGAGVQIAEVAVAQGGITLTVQRIPVVYQPYAFSHGTTQTATQTQIDANIESDKMHHLNASANLGEVVTALNQLGAKPRNLIAIFEALKTAGALTADLEVQ
jgi:flagellar P-ring protein precursor FlgI